METLDPERPIVTATARDSVEFPAWPRERWPEPRYAVRVVRGMWRPDLLHRAAETGPAERSARYERSHGCIVGA